MAVADHQPCQMLQEGIKAGAHQVHVVELFLDHIWHIVKPYRLTGEHAGEHLLQPHVIRRAHTGRKPYRIGLIIFAGFLGQVPAAGFLHAECALT